MSESQKTVSKGDARQAADGGPERFGASGTMAALMRQLSHVKSGGTFTRDEMNRR